MAICHSSGIGETKSYSPGLGFWGVSGSICFRFEVKLNSNHWERGREKWPGTSENGFLGFQAGVPGDFGEHFVSDSNLI